MIVERNQNRLDLRNVLALDVFIWKTLKARIEEKGIERAMGHDGSSLD